ncbi:MAG: M20 metallopeptidase family protein [Tepidiformaceae bacterium]
MYAPLPSVRPEVEALRERLVATRRDFHAHPELSWHEERTQQVILNRLHELGLADVRPIARTGATGLVEGGRTTSGGPAVLWRADIDALPVPEKTGLPFSSTNEGVMHACGHDTHTAIALAIAEVLQAGRAALDGDVRFVFQPAEESAGGAEACIADGVLDAPYIGRALGLHISADVPIGAINVAAGPFFASPTAFAIEITGRGGHAAAPHQAIDAVVVGAHVVTALQTIVSRSIAPSETAVLTIGTMKAGVRGNVIADSARLTGTIRTYDLRVLEQVVEHAERVIGGVCAAFGATYTFTHRTSCPPLVNDAAVTGFVLAEATEFFGAENIFAAPSMGAEDMSVFLEQRPGCYFWLGARNEPEGIAGRHHDSGFVIDEAALALGVEFGVRLIEGSLRAMSNEQ